MVQIQSKPAVSILLPVRNEGNFLPAAINSIFRQTFTDWELIIVDDGSTDNTPCILADAAAHDNRITIVQPEKNGLANALNTGLQHCSAPLLARMDGDDICHPLRFEKQVSYLNHHPETGLVACSFRHFPRKQIKQGMLTYESWQNSLEDHATIMNNLLVESPFVHPAVMLRRCILDQLGGYRDTGWPEDYDLWLRMALAGTRFSRLPETLFFWRDHPERATRTMDEYSRNAFRRCKCDYLLKSFLKSINNVIIAGAGREGRAWQRLLHENNISVTGWIDIDPKKSGMKLHGAIIKSPDQYDCFTTKILLAIGVHGAREIFTDYLVNRGLKHTIDFIAVS